MKNILLINGHPDKNSFNHALAASYKRGALETDAKIEEITITDLNFNPNLKFGYRKRTELEPGLVDSLTKIKKADHIIWFFPVWWAGYPAMMKGFIDRAFLPGITFQPVEGKPFPEKLLKGKTSRLIITSDTPSWYDYLFMKRPAIRQFKKGTLEFCGIKPVKTTFFSVMKDSTPKQRNLWLNKVYTLGKNLQ